MKRILLMLILPILIYGQNSNKSDDFLESRDVYWFIYDEGSEALRFMGVASAPDTNINKAIYIDYDIRDYLYSVYDAEDEALRMLIVGGVDSAGYADTAGLAFYADTAGFAHIADTSFLALFADSSLLSWHSILSDTALFSFLSDSSRASLYSDTSDFAYYSLLSDSSRASFHSDFSDTSLFAFWTDSAGFALLAQYADTSGYSLTSLYADSSRVSNYSNTSGKSDSTRYVVDESGNIVAYGLGNALVSDSIYTRVLNADTLYGHSPIIVMDDMNFLDNNITIGDYIYHYGDAGSQLGFSANDKFSLSLNGVEVLLVDDASINKKMYFNSDLEDRDYLFEGSGGGNILSIDAGLKRVGIGTTAPSELLEVAGNIKADTLYGLVSNSIYADTSRRADTSFYASVSSFLVDTTFDFVAASVGGKLGIKTTNPTTRLHVYDNSSDVTNVGLTIQNAGVGDACINMYAASDFWKFGVDNTNGSFGITQQTTLGTNALTISTNNKVGIGTTPSSNTILHIYRGSSGGTPHITTTLLESNTNSILEFLSPQTTNQGLWFSTGSTLKGSIQYDQVNQTMGFVVNEIPYCLRIDSLGRTGIRTPTPDSTLTIDGSSHITENLKVDNTIITDSVDTRALSVDTLYGSSPIVVMDSLIGIDFISNGGSIVSELNLLIKSLDELKANADSVDEGNKIIHLKSDTLVHYIIDQNIYSEYSIAPPLDYSEAMLSFNNPARWIYTGTNAVFEFLDAGRIYIMTPARILFPDGTFIHVNNPGTNGPAVFNMIGSSLNLIGKKLGDIETGLTALILIPNSVLDYEEGFDFNSLAYLGITNAVIQPKNYARLNYASQTVNFQIGDFITGAISGERGLIVRDIDNGTSGTLTLASITGEFNNGELITGDITGSATTSSLLQNNIFANISDTVLSCVIRDMSIDPTIPYGDRVNIFYIDPMARELSIQNVSGSVGLYGRIGSFFATGSKTQTDPYWRMLNNSGIPNSTAQAKVSITDNTSLTDITAANTPVPINAIWGDGVPERFVFQDVVTFYSTGDTIAMGFTHTLNNGDKFNFNTYTGTLPPEFSEGVNYYVVNKTATNFQAALTPGGSAINFTTNGSGTNYIWHSSTTSKSGWRIYIGLEPTLIAVSGWMTVANSVGVNVSVRGRLMKSDITGTITSYDIGSSVTVNNTQFFSSMFETTVPIVMGEGLRDYIENRTNDNDLIIRNARITYRE